MRRADVRADTDAQMLRRASVRVGLMTGVLVALIVVLLTTVAVVVMISGQQASADHMLAATVANADDVGDPPDLVWLTIRDGVVDEHTPNLPAGLPDPALDRVQRSGRAEVFDVHLSSGDYRVRTAMVNGHVVQAAMFLEPDQQRERRLALMLIMAGLAGLVLAAVAGFWLGRRAVRPMAAALTMQRRFVADAGHELRTPLTLLSTRAQLLRRRAAATEVTQDADGLVRDSEHLNRILEDLLLAADPRAAADETVDLGEVVRDAVAAAGATASARGIEVEVTTEASALVTGSPAALRRAVTALLDNAIQHAARAVRVTVTARSGQVELRVGDDGEGIAPAVLPRVFHRFASFRTTPTGRRSYGLGLALVADIAHRHGGTVFAENADRGGALLRLALPRTRAT